MDFTFDLQNIIDGQGIGIAITGMGIVFFALTLISLSIAALPRVLKYVARRWPEPAGHHAGTPPARPAAAREDLVAAIAMVLHHRRTGT